MIGLDTNVLLRVLIDERIWPEDAPGQMRAARDLVLGSREPFYVNHVVLAETVWVLEHPMSQSRTTVIDILDRLLAAANVVVDRRDVVAAALDDFRKGKPGFADHLIGQINRHAGCETTMTFDRGTRRSARFMRLTPRPE